MMCRFNIWVRTMLLFALSMAMVACTSNRNIERDINLAESLFQSDPQRSLNVISSICREDISSDRTLAHYALVYSEAQYYNRVLVTSDSLTRVAIDYYTNSDDHARRARAFYQHGLIMQITSRMPEAILSLTEAEESLDYAPDTKLHGLIERTKGDIYRANCLYNNSYEAYEKAYACFEELGLPYHINYTLYNMGQAAVKMGKYDLAESYYQRVRDYAIETSNRDLLCVVLHEICELYLRQSEYDKCAATVELFEKYDCALWLVSRYYAVRAVVNAVQGNHDEAMRLIAAAEQCECPDDAIIEEAKYLAYKYIGDLKSADRWLWAINRRTTERLVKASEQPVLNTQLELLKSTLEREEEKIRVTRQRNTAIYGIAVVVLLFVTWLAYSRRKRFQRDRQHFMETIRELQLMHSTSPVPMQEAVDRLYHDRLNDLNRLCETYYEHSDTSRHASKVFEQVRQTIESIKSDDARIKALERVVNECRGNLMGKLREQCPKLNEREMRIALYSYAGFSSRAICIFVESNPVALSKQKYRIKSKIKASNAADADLLIEALSER